jgi:hypothetical protein
MPETTTVSEAARITQSTANLAWGGETGSPLWRVNFPGEPEVVLRAPDRAEAIRRFMWLVGMIHTDYPQRFAVEQGAEGGA